MLLLELAAAEAIGLTTRRDPGRFRDPLITLF